MPHYLTVPGTHSSYAPGEWANEYSAFTKALGRAGWTHTPAWKDTESAERFEWSGDLDGVIWRRYKDWQAAGAALAWYLSRVPLEDRILIAHSHGAQAVAFACGRHGVKVRAVITVMSPVRWDLRWLTYRARPNVAYWLHLYSDRSDWWQALGSMLDGRIGVQRAHPLADLNVHLPGAGHSDVFRRPDYLRQWTTEWLPSVEKASS